MTINEIIETVLNIILPKNKEIVEIEHFSTYQILDLIPQANEIKNSKYKALFQHKNKISRKAVWAIKYHKNKKILNTFSTVLYEFILENIMDEMLFSKFENPILVPIPMHKNNLSKRGYNQSELIAREIFEIDGGKNFSFSNCALEKIKETPHQSELKNKNERLKNLKGCFSADQNTVKGKNIIIIDDVITTGTTMNEATKALKQAGAKKIIGFSLTH